MSKLEHVSASLNELDSVEGLNWAAQNLDRIKFATSLGVEDQVLTHLIASNKFPVQLFTLDTGRLFQETYELLELTQAKYQISIDIYFPDNLEVEQYVKSNGINGFYHSVENRKSCCGIRKVNPLKRALTNTGLWITGLRKSQSANRQQMQKVEWSEEMNVIKYNPLFDWTDDDIKDFIDKHTIPVNTLHKKGFPSIGCSPCTRAVAPGEDERAGRWWWEGSSKECGLHETKVSQIILQPLQS